MQTITPEILKAALLFVSKEDTRFYLQAPWTQRIRGRSIITATDGHTMFLAEDKAGANYPRKPTQVSANPIKGFKPPDWARTVRLSGGRAKKPAGVWFNPKYIERIMRAAKILGVTSAPISLADPNQPATVRLGENALALIMPMRGAEVPHIADWLSEAISEPKAKVVAKPKKRPKAKTASKRSRAA